MSSQSISTDVKEKGMCVGWGGGLGEDALIELGLS